MSGVCACGCGEALTPAQKWRPGHRPIVTGTCPSCGRTVILRDNGLPGMHKVNSRKVTWDCPAGSPATYPTKALRRVTVTLDVVLPEGWSIPEYRGRAAGVLRDHMDLPFLVGVEVEDADDDAGAAS